MIGVVEELGRAVWGLRLKLLRLLQSKMRSLRLWVWGIGFRALGLAVCALLGVLQIMHSSDFSSIPLF